MRLLFLRECNASDTLCSLKMEFAVQFFFGTGTAQNDVADEKNYR